MEVMEFMMVTKTKDEIMATVLRSADSSAFLGRAFIVIIGAMELIGAIKMIITMILISASRGTKIQTKAAKTAQTI